MGITKNAGVAHVGLEHYSCKVGNAGSIPVSGSDLILMEGSKE